MPTARAEGGAASPSTGAPASPPWASLGTGQRAELTLPGVLIGLTGGVIAGAMAGLGGLSALDTLAAGLGLAVPLGLAGAGYELLLAAGKIPLGPLTPIAIYWAIAFPIARVIHAAVVSLVAGDPVAVPHGWLDFVVYQMLLSVGFAIGFWWLHQTFAPAWWFRLRDRNPVAGYFIQRQLGFVGAMYEDREQRKERRKQRRRSGGQSQRRRKR
jgi:hypothetical protein